MRVVKHLLIFLVCWVTAGELSFETKLAGSGRELTVSAVSLMDHQSFQDLKGAGYVPIGRVTVPRMSL